MCALGCCVFIAPSLKLRSTCSSRSISWSSSSSPLYSPVSYALFIVLVSFSSHGSVFCSHVLNARQLLIPHTICINYAWHKTNKQTTDIDLRLQLLEPERYPHLFKCLYGLLMLLPQSTAFATLRNRLTSVSSMGFIHLVPKMYVSPWLYY